MSVSQETLVSALSEVVDPVVNKRLGELKSIREVSIEGDTAKATVDLLSPCDRGARRHREGPRRGRRPRRGEAPGAHRRLRGAHPADRLR
ncbi:MAG: DUF59 domain-containing protein [Deltaproteobacteria bacterium]|nr:DUF59 domain-containing protein [Deltaproteobacteria bacterium]